MLSSLLCLTRATDTEPLLMADMFPPCLWTWTRYCRMSVMVTTPWTWSSSSVTTSCDTSWRTNFSITWSTESSPGNKFTKLLQKKNFNIITFACEWSFKILVSSIQCLSYGQLKVKDWLGVTGGQLNDIIFTVNVYTLALLVNNGQARDIVLDKFMHHIYHLGTNVCYLDMQ